MSPETIESQPKPRDPRALNAYRHGLTGQVHILTPADQVAYEKHCRGIHQSLSPEGDLETGIAQSIADDRWRLQRAAAMESAIFAYGIGQSDSFTGHPEIDPALAQARTWVAEAKQIQLLSLYESRIQRRVEKNLQILHQMQQERKAAVQKAVEEAQLLAQLAASKGESFEPSRDFPAELLPPQFDFSTPRIARLATHNRRLAEAKMRFTVHSNPLRHAA